MNAYRKIKFTTPAQTAGYIAGIIASAAGLLVTLVLLA
jgi:hypothetical protein